MASDAEGPLIGVLALQGSVEEHVSVLAGLGARTREIRTPQEIAGVDGLVLPGGESTAMGIMSEGDGLFSELRKSVDAGVPVYGTCAGLVLLAEKAIGQRDGGQPLVGGLRCSVCRNYFGAQVSSFELPLEVPGASAADAALAASQYPAVFIRAPAILSVGDGCEALATVKAAPAPSAAPQVDAFFAADAPPAKKKAKKQAKPANAANDKRDVVVAARQGNILVTAFHPELTDDTRWHDLFLTMVAKRAETAK